MNLLLKTQTIIFGMNWRGKLQIDKNEICKNERSVSTPVSTFWKILHMYACSVAPFQCMSYTVL
jgi:hypothetical protein